MATAETQHPIAEILEPVNWTEEFESPTRRELADAVNQWEKKSGKYFILAEREKDPLGQKFYQSSAMAYANCANDIRQLLEKRVKKVCQTLSDSRNQAVAP